jgi:hypothetical protein
MGKGFRISFETFDLDHPETVLKQSVLMQGNTTMPTNCLDFSLSHEDQMELLQKALDALLAEKAALINQDSGPCSKCPGKLIKLGAHVSLFSDVFTDHNVKIKRLKCNKCGYEPPSTIKTYLGTDTSGQLAKIQAELGAKHTFRDGEDLLDMFSAKSRKINNHNRIKIMAEGVGDTLENVNRAEQGMLKTEEAKELILNIDGGHIKSKEAGARSFEALTSVIYRPESLKANKKDTRNHLTSKSCAASARNDGGAELIADTIISAIKEGMTSNTQITALCDGAQNCWKVAEALEPLCKKMITILDWFHLAMKIQNISLPEKLKAKLLKIKWHLWRGNTEAAITRLEQLIPKVQSQNSAEKLRKFLAYIRANQNKIVNYRERQKKGEVFTSNLAESTFESLINQRCKGQQRMRWSREGLNPILQLRAKINSQDWSNKWRTVIFNYAQ